MNPDVTWLRTNITNCFCSEKSYSHVHCPCIRCNGKAVPRSTELRHWTLHHKLLRGSENGNQAKNVGIHENDESDQTSEEQEMENPEEMVVDSSEDENDDRSQEAGESIDLKKIVMEAILEAMQLTESTKGSIKNFEDIIYGKKLFCAGLGDDCDLDVVDAVWPKSWAEVQQLLRDHGYCEPKEYFICYCRKKARRRRGGTERHVYTGKWDIMKSKKDTCKHCGRKGKVRYFYLGLEEKIRKWFQDEEAKKRLLAHWEEKDHWLHRETSWENKKEIWDGDRFRELSWFWDPHSSWVVPAMCPKPKCKGVVTAEAIESTISIPGFQDLKRLECPVCYNEFTYKMQSVNGDPRNLAYIGHWDGWSPYKHGNHSCGAIEITVANMRKSERNKIEEVYVIGFVPFHALPKGNPHLLDPFLQPFVNEIKEGFIKGIEINSSSHHCDNYEDSSSPDRLRHLLLCFTGDYPAICEIGKFLNGGKTPCRRCKVSGQCLPTADHYQMYYGENRIHGRHPFEQRDLQLEIDVMTEIQSELRTSKRKKLSSEKGFTGLSVLHQLYVLYGFDVLKDLVYDVHHAIPLNVIKNQVDRFVQEGILDSKEVEKRLNSVKWTSELKDGRVPSGFDKRRGHWKAEEYQKFSFPISEWILEGLLPPEEFEIWSTSARLTELHYVSGRHGWTSNMIMQNQKLALKFNILSEEVQGLQMCRITNHNLLHFSEDLKRFGASDNYWCYAFERAVKKYVSRTSNCKHIEKTYARAEERRELMKTLKPIKNDTHRYPYSNKSKLIAKSYEEAQMHCDERGCIIGSSNNIYGFSQVEAQIVSQMFDMEADIISCVSVVSNKAFIPKESSSGLLLRKGESFIAIQEGAQQVFTAEQFMTVQSINGLSVGTVAKVRCHPISVNEGEKETHYWTGFQIVLTSPTNENIIKMSAIERKVILGPICDNLMKSIVIDYSRPVAIVQQPVVPCYPEVGDMVAIQGEEIDDIWFGHVLAVNGHNKEVAVNFFVENPRWPGRNLYVREFHSHRAREIVNWKSILEVARGSWVSGSTWKLLYVAES